MDLLFCYFSEGRILGDLESCLEANFEKNSTCRSMEFGITGFGI